MRGFQESYVEVVLYEGVCPNWRISELKHLEESARLSRMIRQHLDEADSGPGTPEVYPGGLGLVQTENEAREWISFIGEQFPRFRSVVEPIGFDKKETMVVFWRGVRIPGYGETQKGELIDIFESAGFVPNPKLKPDQSRPGASAIWRRALTFPTP